MAMGLGHCPHCGAALPVEPRAFCVACGSPIGEAAPAQDGPQPVAPQPVAPPPPPQSVPVWSAPPQAGQPQAWPGSAPSAPAPAAPPPATYAQPAPAWGGPPQAGQPQAWPSSPQTAPARARVNPAILVVGALVVLVIVGAVAFVALNGSSSGGPVPGTYTISPASFGCSKASSVTVTITLPASVKGSDLVQSRFDGADWGSPIVVSTYFTSQPDGSWRHEDSPPNLSACQGPSGKIAQGTHKLQLVDSGGKVLAEGSFTVTP